MNISWSWIVLSLVIGYVFLSDVAGFKWKTALPSDGKIIISSDAEEETPKLVNPNPHKVEYEIEEKAFDNVNDFQCKLPECAVKCMCNKKGTITNKLPDKFVQQAVYDPEQTYPIAPSNADLYEKTADFGTEQTNVAQFFASNPQLLQRDCCVYVPDVDQWNMRGTQMYNNMLNGPRAQLTPYNIMGQVPMTTLNC